MGSHRCRLAGTEHGQADAQVPAGAGFGVLGVLQAQPLPAQAASWHQGSPRRHPTSPWCHRSVTPSLSPTRCVVDGADIQLRGAKGVRVAEPRCDAASPSHCPHLEDADDGFGTAGPGVQHL